MGPEGGRVNARRGEILGATQNGRKTRCRRVGPHQPSLAMEQVERARG